MPCRLRVLQAQKRLLLRNQSESVEDIRCQAHAPPDVSEHAQEVLSAAVSGFRIDNPQVVLTIPSSPIWVVFSLVPFSAPVLVMLRLGITGVPTWQLVASMAILIASVLGGLWIAAKLLRIYLLMYGKRSRLREIVRALRAG